jgi:membrane protein YqaA with SNARE-associated domain
MGWLKSLYHWTLQQAEKPRALGVLFAVSFAESSFFPIPPDALLAPIVLARRAWWWLAAAICTLGSVLGGIFGYVIGKFAFNAIGQPLLALLGKQDSLQAFEQTFNAFGWQLVFLAGFTPIPYKVFTIASGAFDVALAVFIIASVVSRGGRFFLVAGIVAVLGPIAKPLIEKYFGWFTLAAGLVIVAGVLAYTALH